MFNWPQTEWIKSTQGNAIFAQFQPVSTFVFIDIHLIKNERISKERLNSMLVQEEIEEAELL